MANKRVLLATWPFGSTGRKPLDLLEETGWELVFNPHKRRLKLNEVGDLLKGIDAVVAGTEPYTAETLRNTNRLKVISRVGIGLDSVDLQYCHDHRIGVTYTPDAPSAAVAELTVANILNLSRHIHRSHRSVQEGAWNRFMGRLVQELTIGIIGAGRIGRRVINLLQAFQPTILANDIDPAVHGTTMPNTKWCSTEEIVRTADIISVHIPMCEKNHHFINRSLISNMKTGASIINTSRGGIVDTEAIVDALAQDHLGGAALDVFENEPYEGPLSRFENVVLTAHIGASARQSRYLMELGAAEDCIRVLNGDLPQNDAFRDYPVSN